MKKICNAIIIFIFYLGLFSYPASAMDTNFSTIKIDEKDQQEIWDQMNPRKVDLPLEEGKEIISFAVNQYGNVAIVFQLTSGERIDVYDTNGEFLYGLAFDFPRYFQIEYDRSDNQIIVCRGYNKPLIKIDEEGHLVEMQMATDTDKNRQYYNKISNRTEIKIGSDVYYLQQGKLSLPNFLTPHYSKIIKRDSNGTQTIIFDGSSEFDKVTITKWIKRGIFVIIVICMLLVIIRYRKKKRKCE